MHVPLVRLFLVGVSLLLASCSQREASEPAPADTTPTPVATDDPPPVVESDAPSQGVGSVLMQPLVVDTDPRPQMTGVVRCLLEDSRGRIWFGGEDLFCLDGAELTCYVLTDDLGRGVTIKDMVEAPNGTIWCGTHGGISKIEGDLFASYGEAHGLIGRDVWSLAVDAGGELWIGTLDGVCRFDGSTFTAFELPEAEPDPTRGITSGAIVHDITVDGEGRVWFGTNGGAYAFDGDALSNLSSVDGLPNDAVGSVLADSAGNLWFGTTHGGISRFDGRTFTNFTADGRVVGQEIWSLCEDRSGGVWFSGKHFGVYRIDGETFDHFDGSDGLASAGLMSILEDREGRLWLGGVGGLFRRVGESFTRMTIDGPWE